MYEYFEREGRVTRSLQFSHGCHCYSFGEGGGSGISRSFHTTALVMTASVPGFADQHTAGFLLGRQKYTLVIFELGPLLAHIGESVLNLSGLELNVLVRNHEPPSLRPISVSWGISAVPAA